MNRIFALALPALIVAGCSTFKEDPRSTSTELPEYARAEPDLSADYGDPTESYQEAVSAYEALPGAGTEVTPVASAGELAPEISSQDTLLQPAPVQTAALPDRPQGIDTDSGIVSWADAVTLIKAGEVSNFTGVGGAEVLLDLCSGRSVLTTAPDAGAIFTVTPPQTICGQEEPMLSRMPQG